MVQWTWQEKAPRSVPQAMPRGTAFTRLNKTRSWKRKLLFVFFCSEFLCPRLYVNVKTSSFFLLEGGVRVWEPCVLGGQMCWQDRRFGAVVQQAKRAGAK